jgi:hypothetical protein
VPLGGGVEECEFVAGLEAAGAREEAHGGDVDDLGRGSAGSGDVVGGMARATL